MQAIFFDILLVNNIWTSGWVQLLILITLILTFIIVYKLRARHQKHQRFELISKARELNTLLQYARENEQKAKLEAEKVQQATGDIFAKLSHDIRTPLNGVTGMVTMLQGTSLSGEQQNYLKTIERCSSEILRAFDDTVTALQQQHPDFDASVLHTAPEPIPAPAAAPVTISADFARRFPMKILVAEDDAMNQQMAVMILRRLGYEADVAPNGKEVLEIVSNAKYDLILMDVQMPEMDGLEATRMIRLCLDQQPVIVAMTANALQGDREACLKAGMNDYISKPVKIEALMEKLAAVAKTPA